MACGSDNRLPWRYRRLLSIHVPELIVPAVASAQRAGEFGLEGQELAAVPGD